MEVEIAVVHDLLEREALCAGGVDPVALSRSSTLVSPFIAPLPLIADRGRSLSASAEGELHARRSWLVASAASATGFLPPAVEDARELPARRPRRRSRRRRAAACSSAGSGLCSVVGSVRGAGRRACPRTGAATFARPGARRLPRRGPLLLVHAGWIDARVPPAERWAFAGRLDAGLYRVGQRPSASRISAIAWSLFR